MDGMRRNGRGQKHPGRRWNCADADEVTRMDDFHRSFAGLRKPEATPVCKDRADGLQKKPLNPRFGMRRVWLPRMICY